MMIHNAVVPFRCGCWIEVKDDNIYDWVRCFYHSDCSRFIVSIEIASLGRSVTITDAQSFDKVSIPLIKRFDNVLPTDDWYLNIEEPIRDIVKLLRNNGWNTTCSCGHEMTIELDIYGMDQIETLATFLRERDYKSFSITGRLEAYSNCLWRRYCRAWGCIWCNQGIA